MKLGLGAAQFGMDYGVTNAGGRTSAEEIRRILDIAGRCGVEIIDTASGYGDSEQVLGEILEGDPTYKIVTKTPDWKGEPPEDAGHQVKEVFERSLKLLRRNSVYGLLVHNADDMISGRGDDIWLTLKELQDRGLIQKIGVSVYTGLQIDHVLERSRPDIIQLPLNVLDQRLQKSGHLEELRARRIQVLVRSVFLQGLLLIEPSLIPDHLSALRGSLTAFRDEARNSKLTPLEAALAYVQSLPGVDAVVVGATTIEEFESVAAAFETLTDTNLDWASLAANNEAWVDPRNW